MALSQSGRLGSSAIGASGTSVSSFGSVSTSNLGPSFLDRMVTYSRIKRNNDIMAGVGFAYYHAKSDSICPYAFFPFGALRSFNQTRTAPI